MSIVSRHKWPNNGQKSSPYPDLIRLCTRKVHARRQYWPHNKLVYRNPVRCCPYRFGITFTDSFNVTNSLYLLKFQSFMDYRIIFYIEFKVEIVSGYVRFFFYFRHEMSCFLNWKYNFSVIRNHSLELHGKVITMPQITAWCATRLTKDSRSLLQTKSEKARTACILMSITFQW